MRVPAERRPVRGGACACPTPPPRATRRARFWSSGAAPVAWPPRSPRPAPAGRSCCSKRRTGSAASSPRRASARSTSTSTSSSSAALRATIGCATMLRDHYRALAGDAGRRADFNPGTAGSPASRSSHASPCGDRAHAASRTSNAGRLTIHRRMKAVARRCGTIASPTSLRWGSTTAVSCAFIPSIVIDATELGDLLPLVGAEHVVGAETIAQTGEPQAQPQQAEAALRAELHLHLRLRAASRRRAPRRSLARRSTSTTGRRSPTACASRSTAARSMARRAAGSTTRCTTPCPARRAGSGPTAGCSTARASAAASPHDLTLFNWPGNDYRDRSLLAGSRARRGAGAAGRQARQPRLPALAADRGARDGDATRRARAAPAARRHGHARRPLEVSLHPRVAPHPGDEDRRGAGGVGAAPVRAARGALRRLGGRRLVSDRHPSQRPRRRRRQLPHEAVPDSARRAGSRARSAIS